MTESYKRFPFEYDIPPSPPPNTFYIWSTPDGNSIIPEAVTDTATLTSTDSTVLITSTPATDTINFKVNTAVLPAAYIDQVYVAAEAITASDVVYINGTGQARRASNLAFSSSQSLGIALQTVAPLNTVIVRRFGRAPGFTGLTIGALYFLDSASGQVTVTPTTTAGSWLVKIGWAATTTDIDLDIQIIAGRA